MKISNKPILLVEDDQVDIMTVNRALKEIHVTNPVVSRENGEEAIHYLRDPESEQPCIILLDLNMPIMNGIEFLQVVKHKVNSFNLGVAGYMAKPVDYRQFVEVMRSIDAYWTISEMP